MKTEMVTAYEKIRLACQELGWKIAIPTCSLDIDLPGVLIGESAYIDLILGNKADWNDIRRNDLLDYEL